MACLLAACLAPAPVAPPPASPASATRLPARTALPAVTSTIAASRTPPTLPPALGADSASPSPAPPAAPTTSPTPLPALSLEEKIGLVLLSGIEGTQLNAGTRALIARWRVGGIVLRGRNVRDADQVRALAGELQAEAAEAGRRPLFLAVDQEGGDVTRVTTGLTHFPSPMTLGAAGDPDLARRVGQAAAADLLSLGLNVNLAPSLDVLTQPDNTVISTRSFGGDPRRVGALGTAYLEGTLAAGALPVVKHYPGHGGTTTDSHTGLPRLDWPGTEPFDTAIAAGAPVVMLGHLWVQDVDAQPLPASLSPAVIARLRQGFGGVILTDALDMGAVSSHFPPAEAAVAAFAAGADWLLFARPEDIPPAAEALREAVETGQIPEARLDESVRRLLGLRAWLQQAVPASADPAAQAALALEAARRGLTLVCPPAQACSARLPAEAQKILLVVPARLPRAEAGAGQRSLLGQLLAAHGYRVTELLYPVEPEAGPGLDFVAQAELYARAAGAVVFGTWDAHGDAFNLQTRVFARLRATGRPLVVLGLHTPYDLLVLDPPPVYLAAYGDTPSQMQAVAEALLGDLEPGGRLPLRLP